MNSDIYTEAHKHFLETNKQYEYGGPSHAERSRTEQDSDHNGKYGVDCSALVWRGLKDAGYDVGKDPFTTRDLFKGHTIEPYAKAHFDVVSAADTRKPNGSLQAGDIVMFKEKGKDDQHVGIFKGYDKSGHIEFLGSQVSTGPHVATVAPGGYWDGGTFEIVGALRAKAEFQVRQPVHEPTAEKTSAAPSRQDAAHPAATSPHHADNLLKQGTHGAAVSQLQESLGKLGYYKDAEGHPLKPDKDFGPLTKQAVEAFQRDHHLNSIDGKVGPETQTALNSALKAQATETAAAKPLGLDSLKNPDHAMYQQALDGVHKLDAATGRTPDQHSAQLAAALTAKAKAEGLTRIDTVAMSTDGSHTFAAQNTSPLKKVADVPTLEGLNTSVEKSSAAAHAAQPAQAAAQAQAPSQNQTAIQPQQQPLQQASPPQQAR